MKGYVFKVITGRNETDIIPVSSRGEVGQIILALLTETPDDWKPERREPGQAYITMRLFSMEKGDRYRYSKNHLPPEGLKMCVQVFNRIYKNMLKSYVSDQKRLFGLKELPAIRKFRELYNISEDDCPEDHMYRTFKNWKKEIKIK